jgi:hypothetical protein
MALAFRLQSKAAKDVFALLFLALLQSSWPPDSMHLNVDGLLTCTGGAALKLIMRRLDLVVVLFQGGPRNGGNSKDWGIADAGGQPQAAIEGTA